VLSGKVLQKRFVVLSDASVSLSKIGSDLLLYQIPLHEISEVQTQGENTDKGNSRSHWNSSQELISGDDVSEYSFIIQTKLGGEESGRSTVLVATSEEEKDQWVTAIRKQVVLAQASELARIDGSWTGTQRRRVKEAVTSDRSQMVMGGVIVAAYLSSLISAQILPEENSQAQQILLAVEFVVTVIFTIELALNLFGHSNDYLRPFFRDSWLVCDLVVVCFMLVGLVNRDLPAINVIRLVRVFKMVCLYT